MHHAIHHPSSSNNSRPTLPGHRALGQHEKILQQAQKWVAQTFYGTLLKQVRQSPFHSKLFEGGRGGEAFQSMYDQKLAEHMARSTGKKLVNSIARKIEAKQAYGKHVKTHHLGASLGNSTSLLRSLHAATALRA